MDPEKLKIDSDEAIQRALKEPALENVRVTATQMKLEHAEGSFLGKEGMGEPVWKLKIWAAKNSDGLLSVLGCFHE